MTSYKNNVNLSIASVRHFVRLKNSSIITNSESAIKDCHYFQLCFKTSCHYHCYQKQHVLSFPHNLFTNCNLTYFTSNNLSLNYRTKQRTRKLIKIQQAKENKSMEQPSSSSSFENIMKHTHTYTS